YPVKERPRLRQKVERRITGTEGELESAAGRGSGGGKEEGETLKSKLDAPAGRSG
ncbi:hypothetical protein P7K49_019747, partial [Saguinus oedipus]